jgi:NADP-dependent 3-hydroxy acid dehydrogenase YdfG
MRDISGISAAITGASSGIGEAIARLLAERGARVMLGARREGNLERIAGEIRAAGGTAEHRACDVTRRADVTAFVEAAVAAFGRIDVLVNNAGLMPLAPLSERRVDEWEQMVDVNIKGVLYGIAAVLPHMEAQHDGHVITLSSIAGHIVFPSAAVYCATKFAVRALSEGLRMESGPKLRTTIISPGAVATELPKSIGHAATAQAMAEAYGVAIGADAVARAVLFAIEQPADVDINEIIVRPTAQTL